MSLKNEETKENRKILGLLPGLGKLLKSPRNVYSATLPICALLKCVYLTDDTASINIYYVLVPWTGFEHTSVELHQPGTFWRTLYLLSYRAEMFDFCWWSLSRLDSSKSWFVLITIKFMTLGPISKSEHELSNKGLNRDYVLKWHFQTVET